MGEEGDAHHPLSANGAGRRRGYLNVIGSNIYPSSSTTQLVASVQLSYPLATGHRLLSYFIVALLREGGPTM